LVSAKPAIMKIRKPMICGTMFQIGPWPSTTLVSDNEPVIRTTPSSARPIETSYEISCAADRIAPRKLYFEPDDQPASSSP
jgi:hypothetical protein